MPSSQRYYLYADAVHPALLDLGSLVFDYRNPTELSPYRLKPLTAEEVKKWTVEDERADAWLSHDSKQGLRFGGGLDNILDMNIAPSSSTSVTVLSKEGSKRELANPQEFLNEVVLDEHHDSARGKFWLSSRLAISRRMKAVKDMTFQHPHIWMVTGIYTLVDAKYIKLSAADAKYDATAALPLPDPSGVSVLLQLMPKIKIGLESGQKISEGAQVMGNQVWAARFQRLDVKYKARDTCHGMPKNQIMLLNVYSAAAVRGEPELAQLDLGEETSEPPGSKDAELRYERDFDQHFDEHYWREFSEQVEKVETRFREELDEGQSDSE